MIKCFVSLKSLFLGLCLWLLIFSIIAAYLAHEMSYANAFGVRKTIKIDTTQSIKLFIFKDKIANVLKELVKTDGFSTKISDKIRGDLERRQLVGSLNNILNELSREYDFDWFVHSKTLYVSDRSEKITRVVKLDKLDVDSVMAALNYSDLVFERFPIIPSEDKKSFVISGPPNYVALAEAIVASRQNPAEGEETNTLNDTISIYRGIKRTDEKID